MVGHNIWWPKHFARRYHFSSSLPPGVDIFSNLCILVTMLRKWANMMKAMSDETRLKILSILFVNDAYVGEIAKKVGISPSVASRHLRTLENAGLVTRIKLGNRVKYRANREETERMLGEMIKYLHRLEINQKQEVTYGLD